MRKDPDNALSDAEREAMQAMPAAQAPPDLEDRTVSALKTLGLIHTRRGGLTMKLAATFAAAAAIVLSFITGSLVTKSRMQRLSEVASTETKGMHEYMLLMFDERGAEDETTAGMTAEERIAYDKRYQSVVDEYRQWAEDRRQENRLVSAEKLADTVRILTSDTTTSTPAEGRVLGGYFLIRANSLEEAEDIARTHPHLRYGGEVEIRPIDIVTGGSR